MRKIAYGFVLPEFRCSVQKGLLDYYNPPTVESPHYTNWIAVLDLKTCFECRDHHGEIYPEGEEPVDPPPIHPNCRCSVRPMSAVIAGNATKNGEEGADWYLKHFGRLPDYYITMEELEALGWRLGNRPSKYAPGKMLAGGIYKNDDRHLPQVSGRIWYEADINYSPGRRNTHRILWSNDGLIFVTYDHYRTFYEIL